MNRVFEMLKKYMFFIMVLTAISIVLGMSYSNFKVTSENHKVAEMYIGTLKYSMTIDGSTTNTLSVPNGETIVDVTVTNENPIDTYYKLIYQNNSNITIKYYGSTKDTEDNVTNYSSPNDKITSSSKNTIKLKITNNSTSSQNITFKIIGGFATNALEDVTVPTGYTAINIIETPSTNTYFCTTTDTLTQGLQYVNGQYTYAYKQKGWYASSSLDWRNINNNGWGIQLTDKKSTDAVTSKLCTYINNKPITSMSYMFYNSQATTLDLSNFDTSNVTDMSSMFMRSKTTTLDVSHFDTSKVTSMFQMFTESQATTLDLSNFNTSNVTSMSSMFYGSSTATLDLNSFDTSKVTNMSSMFHNSQATTLDLSNFNTSNVTNMSYMFWNSQATTIDVSNFDTSKVTNMSYMFYNSQATTLDLSNFDTSKVTNMSYMFSYPTKLTTIYASDKFNTDNVTTSTDMFNSCTKIVGGAGTKYNSSYVDKTYAHIDGGTSNPGYFTNIADKPSTFPTDSWETIATSVKAGNTRGYKVGETKTIDMGTYGTHTLRIANTSTPSECSTTGFSQTACGFVLEFADVITTYKMNDTNTNVGGWSESSMRTFLNNDIYNALPSDLEKIIINTTVISGHGSNETTNFTSTDKLYLLSPKEIYTDWSEQSYSSYDTARNLTRTLDYYVNIGVTTTNYSGATKKRENYDPFIWLRTPCSTNNVVFLAVSYSGEWSGDNAGFAHNVSSAFRIG